MIRTITTGLMMLLLLPPLSGCGSSSESDSIAVVPPPTPLLLRADRSFLRGTGPHAVELVEKVLAEDPESFQAHLRLGAYHLIETPESAREHLEKARDLAPNHPSPVFLLGLLDFYDHGYKDSNPMVKRGLELARRRSSPALADTSDVLREALDTLNSGSASRAVKALRELAETEENDSALWYLAGLAEYRSGNPAEGEVLAGRAIALDYENASAHALSAACLYHMQRGSAADAAAKALEMRPDLALAHYIQGRIALDESEYNDAWAALFLAFLEDPTIPEYPELLGSNLIRFGQGRIGAKILSTMDWIRTVKSQ